MLLATKVCPSRQPGVGSTLPSQGGRVANCRPAWCERCGSGPDHRSTTLLLHARGRFVAAEPRAAFGGAAVLVDTANQATAVVVIPARGGSKGLPGKNLRSVGGVPLIVRAIDAAAQANTELFVVVSTD